MKIYIAGKITNDPNFQRKFADAERKLTEQNVEVINPAKISSALPQLTHREYMSISFILIDTADAVAFLPDWGESCGASQEMGYAIARGKEIYFVDDFTTFS